ncbi:LuxR family transcriptional regulator [Magnetovibrio sp.]|uniref:helix-turn-helix transcriptional regulator n=1 Tax=Magnetovibrio sp. TaxID=2024836 RepID=UPI002F93080D
MTVAEFIEKSLGIDDPNRLFGAYLQALSEYGVDRVMYLPVRNTPYSNAMMPGLSHCYPEDWLTYYVEQNYAPIDPTLLHGMGVRDAFSWEDMKAYRDLSSRQILLMNQGKEAGLNDGVGVPLHGPMGEVYGVGLASSEPNPRLAQHLKELQILSTNFHVFYAAMHDEMRNAHGVQLTPRELEVLKWCAAGKSNWSIGEILSISEHGVDFHMRNILRKLDADNRITAVVKAIHSGLISL